MTEESRKQAPILVSLSIREMGYSPIVIDEASLTLFPDRVELCVPFTSFLVTILLKDVFQLQWRAATEELVLLTGTYVRREYVLTSRRSPSLWSTAPGPSFTAETLAALSDEELAARSAAPPTLAMMYDILRPRIVEREVQFPAGASSWLWEQAREGSVWTPAAEASFQSGGGGPASNKTPFRTPMYQATALSSPHWNRSGPTDLTQVSAPQPLEAMPGTQRAAAQLTMLRRRPPDLMTTTTADMVQTPPPSRNPLQQQHHQQWNHEAAPSSSLQNRSGRHEELEEVAALAKRMGGASSSRRTLYGANAAAQDVSHDYSRSNRSVEMAGHPQSVRQPPHKQEMGREEEEAGEEDEHDRHKTTPLRAALRAMQLRKQNQINGRSGGPLMVETPPQSQQARAMFQQWRSEVTESILAQKSSTPPSSANPLLQKQTASSVAGRGGSSPLRTQWAVTPDHGTTNPTRPSPLAVPAENIECPPCPRWLLTRNVVVLQQQANALHQPVGQFGGFENRQTTAPSSSSSSSSLPPQQPDVGAKPPTTTQPNYAHWLEGVVPATPTDASSSQPVPAATTTLHHVAQASTPDIPLARDSILDGIAIHHPYLPPNPGLTLTADPSSPRGGSTGRTPPLLKPQPILRQGSRASPPTSQLQRVRQAQASSGSPPPPRLPSPSGSPPPPPSSQFAASHRDSSTPIRMMGGASAHGNPSSSRPPPPLARPRTPQGSVSNRAAGSSPSLYRSSSSTAGASASEVGRLPLRRPPPRAEPPESQQGQQHQPTAYSAAALSPTRRQTTQESEQVRAGSPADGFGFGRLMSRRN